MIRTSSPSSVCATTKILPWSDSRHLKQHNAGHHPRPHTTYMRDFVMGRRVHAVVRRRLRPSSTIPRAGPPPLELGTEVSLLHELGQGVPHAEDVRLRFRRQIFFLVTPEARHAPE